MWGQTWNYIYDLLEPYKGQAKLDVTAALVEQVCTLYIYTNIYTSYIVHC